MCMIIMQPIGGGAFAQACSKASSREMFMHDYCRYYVSF